MDLKIIGKFIKERRKLLKLTQTELADKLNISEKTISKWECGNGFPDTSLMLPLCNILNITANELLSGKKLSDDEYKSQAESNLVLLKSQQERSSKFLLNIEWVLGYMSSITLFVLVFVASFAKMASWIKVVLIAVGFIHFIFGIHFCLLIEKDAGFYECPHCHHKYIPTYKQILLSAHMGRTRHMKCPNCGKRGWNKKVIK